jgi:hypothetical protein
MKFSISASIISIRDRETTRFFNPPIHLDRADSGSFSPK